MKFKKDDNIVEVNDPNTYNLFERAGFEPVVEADKVELVKKAKELGIKGAHLMSVETLQQKIEEV